MILSFFNIYRFLWELKNHENGVTFPFIIYNQLADIPVKQSRPAEKRLN